MSSRSMTEQQHRRETCWRVVEGPSGRVVVCAIYETASAGLELPVGYGSDHTIRSERLADAASARARAEQWLKAFRIVGQIHFARES